MDFRILGPFEVHDGRGLVPLGAMRQRAVLAVLLTRANEVVSRDRLIDELWGDRPPETAVNVLQTYISQLRKVLPAGVLETRAPGYLVRVEPLALDLHRFEELIDRAGEALAAEHADEAAQLSREALALWRGAPLADFTDEPFAQGAIARLEELRFAALERRIEADLSLGRHEELVGELRALVSEHRVHERLQGQLMLALYRSGRQAEALEAFQTARRALEGELGIDPSPALRELERAILRQDPSLDPANTQLVGTLRESVQAAAAGALASGRSLLVAAQHENSLGALAALAEPMARRPPRDVILARLVAEPADLSRANASLQDCRERLRASGVDARAAAFTSGEIGEDLVRLASQPDVDLLLLDTPAELLEDDIMQGDIGVVVARAPCDVGLLVGANREAQAPTAGRPVLVPFGGAEHEWAATEIGAWIASAQGVHLQLLGAAEDPHAGRRDASRLLASAALIVQQVAGVRTEPLLVEPGDEAVIEASENAGLLVVGFPSAWRQEGLGSTRLAVARGARSVTLLVRSGLRPGGLAPPESLTRFRWTLAGGSQ